MNTRAWHLVGGDSSAQSLNQAGRLFALLHLFVALLAGQAMAQDYSIDWYTIDGGGGTSTNGQYSLTGTIGRTDPSGSMTNGPYSLTGGFWVLPAVVQEPGAPMLTVVPAARGFALISWAPNTPGFVLQESLTLDPPAWTNSPSGSTNPVSVPTTPGAKVYRLLK